MNWGEGREPYHKEIYIPKDKTQNTSKLTFIK